MSRLCRLAVLYDLMRAGGRVVFRKAPEGVDRIAQFIKVVHVTLTLTGRDGRGDNSPAGQMRACRMRSL